NGEHVVRGVVEGEPGDKAGNFKLNVLVYSRCCLGLSSDRRSHDYLMNNVRGGCCVIIRRNPQRNKTGNGLMSFVQAAASTQRQPLNISVLTLFPFDNSYNSYC